MNQILFSKFNQEIEKQENRKKRNLLIVFKYQFAISILVILLGKKKIFLNNYYLILILTYFIQIHPDMQQVLLKLKKAIIALLLLD